MVCVSYAAEGRHVVRGVVGCPRCHAEFPIVDGVLDLLDAPREGGGPAAPGEGVRSRVAEASAPGAQPGGPGPHPEQEGAADALTPDALATFLDLRGPGGYAVLVGSAGRLAAGLAALLPGVHLVVVNGPGGERASECSYLACAGRIPLKGSQARAVVLGADSAGGPWLAEATRVLLRGLRLVVEDERASPEGVSELARGAGVFVGAKTGR